MEITVKDLEYFKLSPSLICFLKCLNTKDNDYLIQLDKVAPIIPMAKHLESLGFVKILGNSINCDSFEVRKLDTIDYLNNVSSKPNKDVDTVIKYFKEITGEGRLEQALKSKAIRQTISGRLSEGYTVDEIMAVIKMMHTKWKNDPVMRDYIRIETLCGAKKFAGYVGKLGTDAIKDFSDDI